MHKRKCIEPIPDKFGSYEEAADFWDTHDTTDYPEAFRTVHLVAELRHRHYEIPIDTEVVEALESRALKTGVSLGHLASELLRARLRVRN